MRGTLIELGCLAGVLAIVVPGVIWWAMTLWELIA